MTPEEELLVIYFNELSLCAAFEFPEVPVHDIMYFFKEAEQEINPENFHEEVTFGSLNNTVEGENSLNFYILFNKLVPKYFLVLSKDLKKIFFLKGTSFL